MITLTPLISYTHNGDDTHKNYTQKKYIINLIRCKSKAVPLQVWTDPEDPRRLRLPDFKKIGT